MSFIHILIALSALGIGAVLWILQNEKDDILESPTAADSPIDENKEKRVRPKKEDIGPKTRLLAKIASQKSSESKPEKLSKFSPKSLADVFKKIKLGKNSDEDTSPTPMPGLKEIINTDNKPDSASEDHPTSSLLPTGHDAPIPEGSAHITTSPALPQSNDTISADEEKTIEEEIELTAKLNELKEKYDKLDALYSEKSSEHEKTKESLKNEMDHRKEFNKVKDLLEKELKDSKDKARSVEMELNNTQTDNENHKKRTQELEDKKSKLEKELLQKDDKIDELVKRMQTFASPSTADTPPGSADGSADSPPMENPQESQEAKDSEPSDSPEEPESTQKPVEAAQSKPPAMPKPNISVPADAIPKTESIQQDQEQLKAEMAPEQKNEADNAKSPDSEQKGGFKLDLDLDSPEMGDQKGNADHSENGESNPNQDNNPEGKKQNP